MAWERSCFFGDLYGCKGVVISVPLARHLILTVIYDIMV